MNRISVALMQSFFYHYQVIRFLRHTCCLQSLKITLNWCGQWNSQLNLMKFGDKKLEQFFYMELFSDLIYHFSKWNGNVFFGVIWCETHCSDDQKRVCSRWTRLQREHIFMNFTVPRGSERSEWASPWTERSKAERCGASERSERCERTNVASDRVAR